jgi:5-methyltetrahydrofolate--homocysteine methyltransferase
VAELRGIEQAVIQGQHHRVKDLTEQALQQGLNPKDILEEALLSGMTEVGRRMQAKEFFIPEVMLAARAMKAGMALVEPLLDESVLRERGTIVIGTVYGDLHDIGKNLVSTMFRGAGFEVIDLGVSVPPETVAKVAKEEKADIVALSALLTTTMDNVPPTLAALEAAGIRDQVKVIVGGSPVTQEFVDRVGADGYGKDAGAGVEAVKRLLGVS